MALNSSQGALGIELAGAVASHDAQVGAVLDVRGSPVTHSVSVGVVGDVAQLRIVAAVQGDADHLGHFGTGNNAGGIIAAVVLADDDVQRIQDGDSLLVDDLILVGELVEARSASADNHHGHNHEGGQSQAENPLEVSHLEFLLLKFKAKSTCPCNSLSAVRRGITPLTFGLIIRRQAVSVKHLAGFVIKQ